MDTLRRTALANGRSPRALSCTQRAVSHVKRLPFETFLGAPAAPEERERERERAPSHPVSPLVCSVLALDAVGVGWGGRERSRLASSVRENLLNPVLPAEEQGWPVGQVCLVIRSAFEGLVAGLRSSLGLSDSRTGVFTCRGTFGIPASGLGARALRYSWSTEWSLVGGRWISAGFASNPPISSEEGISTPVSAVQALHFSF
ncbi:hypothetical protein Taro_027448 [Colocasia esculenta]|uniref:Uncharacterized protein n=1 Tax=Colocasia esculenta TaxID=4460 RepID=A0A843VNS7_COLES|nr:hypothetical protein [Colocasia esculenta]